MNEKGKIIEIEGTDGTGKKTQSKLLMEKLKEAGLKVELISFPRYNEFFGSLIKRYLDGEFGLKEDLPAEFVSLLYALDRYQIKKEVSKKLKEGKILVMDRYYYSNLAHQGAKFVKRNEQDEFITWLKVVESKVPRPSKKIFLDLPIDVTQKLMENEGRGKKDQHEADMQYLERVREIYKRIVLNEKDWISVKCAKLENGKWFVRSREEIHEEIWNSLKAFFGVQK